MRRGGTLGFIGTEFLRFLERNPELVSHPRGQDQTSNPYVPAAQLPSQTSPSSPESSPKRPGPGQGSPGPAPPPQTSTPPTSPRSPSTYQLEHLEILGVSRIFRQIILGFFHQRFFIFACCWLFRLCLRRFSRERLISLRIDCSRFSVFLLHIRRCC